MSTSSQEPKIKFNNEESKAQIRYKLGQNLLNLVDLTRSVVKSSESSELFKTCFRTYLANEPLIESTCDKLNKIEIISKQLNFQADAIKRDCELLKEVCDRINSIQTKKY